MLVLRVALGNVPGGVCLDPRFLYKCATPRLSGDLPSFAILEKKRVLADAALAGADRTTALTRQELLSLLASYCLPPIPRQFGTGEGIPLPPAPVPPPFGGARMSCASTGTSQWRQRARCGPAPA